MAITNQDRVGKAMELLQRGSPFVEREFEICHGKAEPTAGASATSADDRR